MKNSVTVYTTSTCPYCDMMKNFLKDINILFNEVNVQKNLAAANKLVATTGQLGVPQTEVKGKWVLGFDSNALMSLLK